MSFFAAISITPKNLLQNRHSTPLFNTLYRHIQQVFKPPEPSPGKVSGEHPELLRYRQHPEGLVFDFPDFLLRFRAELPRDTVGPVAGSISFCDKVIVPALT